MNIKRALNALLVAVALAAVAQLVVTEIVWSAPTITCNGDPAVCANTAVTVTVPAAPVVPPPPDPVVDCVTTDAPGATWVSGMGSSCVNNTSTVPQTLALIVTKQPSGGGKLCPVPLVRTQSITVTGCGATPPPTSPRVELGTPFTTLRVRAVVNDGTPAPSTWDGAFRTILFPSHRASDDPIVFAGQPGASHSHDFFGNNCTDANSTTQSLLACGRSTAEGGLANLSAAWVPTLYDANKNAITPNLNQVYYKRGTDDPITSIEAIPAGLRSVFGESPNNTKILDSWNVHHTWACDSVYENDPVLRQQIPPCAAGHELLLTVTMPMCWTAAKDMDSPDHRSHLVYANNYVGNRCPASHPHVIPVVSYNITYRVGPGGTTGYKLASDNYAVGGTELLVTMDGKTVNRTIPVNGGRSAHGDYWAGWMDNEESVWLKFCVALPADCHTHLRGDGKVYY